MEQSPSWEADKSSASREIPCILCKPEVYCHIHIYVYMWGNLMHFEINAYWLWCMLMFLSWSWFSFAACMSKCCLLFFFTYSWRYWVQNSVIEGYTRWHVRSVKYALHVFSSTSCWNLLQSECIVFVFSLSFCYLPSNLWIMLLLLSSIYSVSWCVEVIFRVISWYALGLLGSITYVEL
jgi:hypothetical protein